MKRNLLPPLLFAVVPLKSAAFAPVSTQIATSQSFGVKSATTGGRLTSRLCRVHAHHARSFKLQNLSSFSSGIEEEWIPNKSETSSSALNELERCKSDLIRCCTRATKPLLDEVRAIVRDLEDLGEQVGIGQSSAHSGLLTGEWELLYSPEDTTRSSPFFWAYRKAFTDSADQIFGITDNIPPPIKEVGPAYQTIDLDDRTSPASGTLVSRVKVATLGGLATSIMTTRCTIIGTEGLDSVRLRVDSTKPEESTVLQKLGPLGEAIDKGLPPFPSGEALERVRPGSSEVVMRTTYCDESLRISRNEDRYEDVYVWKRRFFGDGGFEI